MRCQQRYEPKFLKEFYEKEALLQNHQSSMYNKNAIWELYWHRSRMLRVMELLLTTTGNFLEVGCAEGLYVKFYSKTQKDAQIIAGLDISRNYIKKAKKRVPVAMWLVADAQNLPFKEGSFDIVLCTEVLEHLQNPKIGFNDACRVSRKRILITAPGEPLDLHIVKSLKLFSLYNRWNTFWLGYNKVGNPGSDSGHISKIRRNDLIKWSNDTGLNVLLLQTTCYFPRPIAYRLRLSAFFVKLARILDSIICKIPYIQKYGLVNILLAEISRAKLNELET